MSKPRGLMAVIAEYDEGRERFIDELVDKNRRLKEENKRMLDEGLANAQKSEASLLKGIVSGVIGPPNRIDPKVHSVPICIDCTLDGGTGTLVHKPLGHELYCALCGAGGLMYWSVLPKKLFDFGVCPICEKETVGQCRCSRCDSECPKGHAWHYGENEEIHAGSSDHGKKECCDRRTRALLGFVRPTTEKREE